MNQPQNYFFLNAKNAIMTISSTDFAALKLKESMFTEEKCQVFSSEEEICMDLAANDIFKSKEEMEVTPIIFSPNSEKAKRYFEILGVKHSDRYVCYILTHYGLIGFTSIYHLKKMVGNFNMVNFNDFKKYRGNFSLPAAPMVIPE